MDIPQYASITWEAVEGLGTQRRGVGRGAPLCLYDARPQRLSDHPLWFRSTATNCVFYTRAIHRSVTKQLRMC
jgi:hypothetical protein